MTQPQYDPRKLIGDVLNILYGLFTVDAEEEIVSDAAYMAACSLLLALGITPAIDPQEHGRAAEMVRSVLAEDQTKTTTRARRQL